MIGDQDTPALSIAVIKFARGVPGVVEIDFYWEADVTGFPVKIAAPKMLICPGRDCHPTHDEVVFLLGYTDEANQRLATKRSFSSPESAVRELIDLEIKAHPSHVGPPIDVLFIDKTGHRWLPPNGECPNSVEWRQEQKPRSHQH
jgi:hypothetical protein